MIEVSTDSRTVWINQDGCCIGRFSQRGFEVNPRYSDVLNGKNLSHDSSYGLPLDQSWARFVESMKEFHNYEVEVRLKPVL